MKMITRMERLYPTNGRTFKKTVQAVAKNVTQPRISKLVTTEGVDVQQATKIAGHIERELQEASVADAILALLFMLDMTVKDVTR